jgi:glycosyltransferase involved in cell wall biosynthesis
MIVKNEAEVLPRLLSSVKDYIDYYVIVDTGSTDDTIALIRQEMAGYGIDGEVHERPWVNFGVNRQQSLELAVEAGKLGAFDFLTKPFNNEDILAAVRELLA